MPFDEEDVVEIASNSPAVKEFEQKHPDCGWNVEKMSSKSTQDWIKSKPNVIVSPSGISPPKNLWIVELEAFNEEKLLLVVNPTLKAVISTETAELTPEIEEDTWEGDEEDDIEAELPFGEDDAIELASTAEEVKRFEDKYPEAVWSVELEKSSWRIELEAIEAEKLIIYINPSKKKITSYKTERIEPEPEEEELEDEEEEEIEEERIFSEDDAIEIASATSSAQNFEQTHPSCVWNVEKLDSKITETWIKEHPDAAIRIKGKNSPDNLWIVELEALESEKLVIAIDPLAETVVSERIDKLESESDDEDDADFDYEDNDLEDEIQPFAEDHAVEIASTINEVKIFQNKYPDSIWNVEKMKPKATAKWIKEHQDLVTFVSEKDVAKSFWIVELEALEKEKLILIIDPLTQKLIHLKTEKFYENNSKD